MRSPLLQDHSADAAVGVHLSGGSRLVRAGEPVTADPAIMLEAGWLSFEAKDFAAAIREGRALAEAHPGHAAGALRLIVFAAAESDQWAEAAQALDALDRLDDHLARAVVQEAWWNFGSRIKHALDAEDLEAALACFEVLPPQVQGAPELRHLARELAVRLGEGGAKFGDAFQRFGEFLSKRLVGNPGEAENWLQLGHWHLAGARQAESIDAFEKALGLDPSLEAAAIGVVRAYRAAGDMDQAAQACRRAMDVVRAKPGARLEAAWLFFEIGDYAAAIREGRALAEAHPGHAAGALRLIVFAAAESGHWDEAAHALDSLETLDARDHPVRAVVRETWWNFGRHIKEELDAGEFEAALARFETLPPQVQGAPELRHLTREMAVRLGGDGAGSEDAFQRFGEILSKRLVGNPGEAENWLQLGHWHLAGARPGASAEAFDKALTLDPSLEAAAIGAVRAYRAAGELEQAAQACRRAAELVKADPLTRLEAAWLFFEVRDYAAAIVEALALAEAHPGHAAGALRLVVFAAAESDQWDEAAQAFDNLESLDADAFHALVTETCWTFARRIQVEVESGGFRVALQRFAKLPPHLVNAPPAFTRLISHLASVCYYRERHHALGMRYYRRSLGIPDEFSGSRPQRIAPRRLKTQVVTSLMPRRLSVQQAAVKSWQAIGWHILSVNSPNEIAELQHRFPGVGFIAADRNAAHEVGKPLVYFDDLLLALENTDADVLGIINSDIIIVQNETLPSADELAQAAEYSLTFGNRVNSQHEDVFDGEFYLGGYDWFLFGRDILKASLGSGLIFGAPWWDFWMPAATIVSHRDLINIRRPFAFHPDHPLGWSEEAFHALGKRFVGALQQKCLQTPSNSLASKTLHQLTAAVADAGGHDVMDKEVIGRLCQTINVLIQAETRLLDLAPAATVTRAFAPRRGAAGAGSPETRE